MRAAWRACVDEALATGDWERAERHLLALGPERLLQAFRETGAALVVRSAD